MKIEVIRCVESVLNLSYPQMVDDVLCCDVAYLIDGREVAKEAAELAYNESITAKRVGDYFEGHAVGPDEFERLTGRTPKHRFAQVASESA